MCKRTHDPLVDQDESGAVKSVPPPRCSAPWWKYTLCGNWKRGLCTFILFGIVVAGIVVVILAPWKTHDVDVRVSALPLRAGAITASVSAALFSAAEPRAPPSLYESAYAVVDALTLDVSYVRTAPEAGSGRDLKSTRWGAYKQFTLLPNDTTIPLEGKIKDMNPGSYFASDFVFWNKWSIKAHCRTANFFIYTTASGPVRLDATPDVLPDDYAPLVYDYLDGFEYIEDSDDTARNTLAQAHMSFINSQYYYEVTTSSTVRLYVDTSYVVACYDGTMFNRSALEGSGHSMIEPLGYDTSMGGGDNATLRVQVPFNWSAPIFSFMPWTLPVFVHVTDGGSDEAVSETYAAAVNASLLPTPSNSTIDWARVSIMTLLFDASGNMLDLRTRGRPGGGPSPLGVWGGYFGCTGTNTTGYSCYNGQPYYYSYLMLGERRIVNLTRLGDYEAVGTAALVDGPDCGKEPGGTQQPNPCTNTTTPFRYVRLRRMG